MKHWIICCWLAVPFFVAAQGADIDFGITGGVSVYSGDLSPQEFGIYLDDVGITGGAFLRFRLNRFIGFRTSLTYAQVSADEKNGRRTNRRLNFSSPVVQASLMGELNFFHIGYFNSKVTMTPYGVLGIGAFYSDPRITSGGDTYRLRPLGTEGQGLPGYGSRYSPIQFSTPVGLGVQFIVNDDWTIGFEGIAHRTLTDYLDDVSATSVRYGDVLEGNGPDAARFSNPLLDPNDPASLDQTYVRGGAYNDWFFLLQMTISHRISNNGRSKSKYLNGIICPRF
ncbi:MAG: outer membrane beta-barrel protein [Lewinellaceae bacterium]|nr:outer membrane beta-barrel protein [Lewinellaceae bacterium]